METSTGQLVINRPAGHYRDAIRAYLIEVDGEERGALAPGDSLVIEVPAGSRTIQANIDWTGSPRLTVDVRAGARITMVVEPGGSAFTALFQLFKPRSYLKLSIHDAS